MDFYILIISFFIIALIYSSVGFGGGTSYLALMGVMLIDFQLMRPTALICNIIVVTAGTFIFYKEGHLNIRKSWPFLVAGIPMAFLGGYWPIRQHAFFITLGFSLEVAAFLLWFQNALTKRKENGLARSDNIFLNLSLGGGIGFLSGLVSIGGGIFLSPVLHLLNWDQAKKISALASLFILVNSISGLAGQLSRSSSLNWSFIWPLLIAVFLGGQIGSRMGARKLNPSYIRRITAILILVAGLNILKDHL
jgi:uncharacterized membrane protein YfcA